MTFLERDFREASYNLSSCATKRWETDFLLVHDNALEILRVVCDDL